MGHNVRNAKDFAAGLVFIVLGGAFAIIGQDYDFGSSRRMGPGYFPIVLSCVLIALGLLIVLRAFQTVPAGQISFAWRPMLINTIGLMTFGLIIRGAGLVPAVFVLSMISAYSSVKFRIFPSLALAGFLSAFSYLTFIRSLGLPFSAFGPWLGQ